jgi:hypothetical protein
MTAIELTDAVVIADEAAGVWYYAPKAPGIATDSNGRPQFNLITAGSVSFLQVTGSWGLGAAEVEDARRELAGKLGKDPASLVMMPAPETVDGVALMLGDGADGYTVLAQGKSSGMPPYHAAFSVMLDSRQLAAVREALDGKRHQLVLRYDITRQTPVTSATAEHVATSEAAEGCGPDGSWSSASGRSDTSARRETVMNSEKLGVQLDAADWPSAR